MPGGRGGKDGLPPNAAAAVIHWLERYIQTRGLVKGSALPGELAIAKAVGLGRSSVREALTTLKTLGAIRSRRKGGIRLTRDPVLLELRHYFADRFGTRAQHADALEFRAAMEWGLGPLTLARVRPRTIRCLRRIIRDVAAATPSRMNMEAAEIRFHAILTSACGNRLAMLFAHLYEPIFRHDMVLKPTPRNVALWVRHHAPMVEALAARDKRRFLAALRYHTHGYMRFRGALRKPSALSLRGLWTPGKVGQRP